MQAEYAESRDHHDPIRFRGGRSRRRLSRARPADRRSMAEGRRPGYPQRDVTGDGRRPGPIADRDRRRRRRRHRRGVPRFRRLAMSHGAGARSDPAKNRPGDPGRRSAPGHDHHPGAGQDPDRSPGRSRGHGRWLRMDGGRRSTRLRTCRAVAPSRHGTTGRAGTRRPRCRALSVELPGDPDGPQDRQCARRGLHRGRQIRRGNARHHRGPRRALRSRRAARRRAQSGLWRTGGHLHPPDR